jgi:hypothetical protein
VSVWKVFKWVAYRLPILATAIFVIMFLTKDELSKSQSPTLLLIVNSFKDHLGLVIVGLLIFLFLCAALWGLADYCERPDLWRRHK